MRWNIQVTVSEGVTRICDSLYEKDNFDGVSDLFESRKKALLAYISQSHLKVKRYRVSKVFDEGRRARRDSQRVTLSVRTAAKATVSRSGISGYSNFDDSRS